LLLILDYFKSYTERNGVLFLVEVVEHVGDLLGKGRREEKKVLSKYEEAYPFPLTDLGEIEEIFTPKREKNRRRSLFEEEHIPPPMPLINENRYKPELYLATSFYNPRTPITRVFSHNSLSYAAYDNPTLNLSPADLINHPKYDSIRGRLLFSKSKSVGDLVGERFSDEDLSEEEKKKITLLLLTMEGCKRRHLELLVRFCGGVAFNSRLRLDVGVSNGELMLELFGDLLFGKVRQQQRRRLFNLLLKNCDFFFGREEGSYLDFLKKKIEQVSFHEEEEDDEKENLLNRKKSSTSLNTSLFCSKISMDEYEEQRLLGETAKSLRSLLDSLCELEDESGFKKRQLRKFQKEYPHIYNEKFSNGTFEEEKKKKKRTPFGVLI